jgi:glycosyltransferase involved in cell wall biosynthesis
VKLAFITPWYGRDIPGGAEAEARRTAEHLHAAGFDVEVWTTCVRDLYSDWSKNQHRPGLHVVNGVPVHRFPVKSRNKIAFDRINLKLMNGLSISAEEECVFIEQMLRIDGLYEHIAQYTDEAVLFFIPYMFATTYYGAQIRPQRSYLIPCLHDEAYARLGIYRRVFEQVRGMLFHSVPEQRLAEKLFRLDGVYQQVIGEGVDLEYSGHADDFRRKYHVDAPFVLYAGRRAPGKKVALLIDYFRRYRASRRTDVRLILIGAGAASRTYRADDGIIDLGFVALQDKWDAYAAAAVLCQPSTHESFSLAIMESWAAATPVLVHAVGAVTVDHCRRANGGLFFATYEEFAACLDVLLADADLRARLGRQGRAYVVENYRWDVIVEKYRQLVQREIDT